jgi:hypothetical protein
MGFSDKWITIGPYEERQEASKRLFPAQFNKVTIVLDGKHTLLQYNALNAQYLYKDLPDVDNNGEDTKVGALVKQSYYSHKTKSTCLNTQVTIHLSNTIDFDRLQ